MNHPSLDPFVPLLRRHTFCSVCTGVSLGLVVAIGLLWQWTANLEVEMARTEWGDRTRLWRMPLAK